MESHKDVCLDQYYLFYSDIWKHPVVFIYENILDKLKSLCLKSM